jgi:hypothetical protein
VRVRIKALAEGEINQRREDQHVSNGDRVNSEFSNLRYSRPPAGNSEMSRYSDRHSAIKKGVLDFSSFSGRILLSFPEHRTCEASHG